MFGVYIHFPYCQQRCPYCDFAVAVRQKIPHERYLRAIRAELAAKAPLFSGRRAVSVYFGGGTPSLWRPDCVAAALGEVLATFPPAAGARPEVTLECDPHGVSDEQLGALRAAGVPEAQVVEAKQRVRHKLLVAGPEGPPRLASYAGRGDLRGFVRVVAVREGIGLLRQTARREAHEVPAADEQLERATVGEDPELLLIKETHRAVLREAFAAALGQLGGRDRTLLRMAVVDGLTVDQLGVAFSVHRATAARWLASVREGLFKRTRRELMARLHIDGREFESLIRVIQSRFEISVCEILRTPAG